MMILVLHTMATVEVSTETVLRIPGSLSQRVKNFLQHSYTLQREAISETQAKGEFGMWM